MIKNADLRCDLNTMKYFFVLLFILFAGPVIADQCIEGNCVNGKGTMVYSTGHKYVGEFRNGLRDGQGFMSMPLGRTLEGQWVRNDATEGTYTYPDGKIYKGSGSFVSEMVMEYSNIRTVESMRASSRVACERAEGQ